MRRETRTVTYDDELRVEAYRFIGTARPFPNHFHEYYVIGLVEAGARTLRCKDQSYTIGQGDILLFNPGDSHACMQSDGGTLDYRGLNISQEVMLALVEEATGLRELPGFSQNVVRDKRAEGYLRALHELLMNGSDELSKEENLLLLLSRLMEQYSRPMECYVPECRAEIERACAFMEKCYPRRIRLNEIALCAGLSKSTLLRAFARAKGVTPYGYLESIRVGKAKKLLEQGVPPAEAALRTGFSDQSHFTNYFSRFMGLSPGSYQAIFSDRDKEGNP